MEAMNDNTSPIPNAIRIGSILAPALMIDTTMMSGNILNSDYL